MHLRYSTSHRKGKTYRYAQLVESYRDESGKPAVKVIAHLGAISDELFNALRKALEAARRGEGLVLESELAAQLSGSILANLRYLDLAVLIECWEQWHLSELINELAQNSETDISLAKLLLALVLQRCVDPGSKLRATRWVGRTALPEMLGFEPQAFNNSRIHRALNALYDIGDDLQHKLAQRYVDADGPPAACFMDLTDTYFEGAGPELAELTRTKSEMPNKRCIGIVLLANERGYPLRWKLVGGKTKDWTAMSALLDDIGSVSWLKQTLIVFDRAMGKQSTVAELKRSGLYFLTAAHRNSTFWWVKDFPMPVFDQVELAGTEASYEEDIKLAAQAARDAGWSEIHELLFAHDFGVIKPPGELVETVQSTQAQQPGPKRGRTLFANLEEAAKIWSYFEAHPHKTHLEAAAVFGVSRSQITYLLSLRQLAPEVQQRIRAYGRDFPCTRRAACRLLKLSAGEQLARVEEMAAEAGEPIEEKARRGDIGPLRMAAYFNPRLFVDMRNRAQRHLREIEEAFEIINAELAQAKRSRKEQTTFRKFFREVERRGYLDAFEIELEPLILTSKAGQKIRSFRGTLRRKEEAWSRRRTYDGIVLLLGHPDLEQTGVELVERYRGKDVVEKDFYTIKSVIELRPLFHYSDPKVVAHVSICMLALLVLRTLGNRLRQVIPTTTTAERCIEELATCHLNLRRAKDDGQPCYEITCLNERQKELVDALSLADRVSNIEFLRTQIQPRDPLSL